MSKEKEMNSEVARMKEIVAAKLEVTAETGTITAPKGVYEECLPESLPVETVKTVHAHDAHFAEAVTRAHTDVALDLFSKHKKLESVETTVPGLGRDKVEVRTLREKEVSGGIGKDGVVLPRKTVHGATTASVRVSALASQGSDLKKFISEAQELFAAKLAKK